MRLLAHPLRSAIPCTTSFFNWELSTGSTGVPRDREDREDGRRSRAGRSPASSGVGAALRLGCEHGDAGDGCERGERAATHRPPHRCPVLVAPAPCAGRDGAGRRDRRRARAKTDNGARLASALRAAWSPQRARTVRCARSRGARRDAEPAAARGDSQSAGAASGPADPRSDARAGLARRGPRWLSGAVGGVGGRNLSRFCGRRARGVALLPLLPSLAAVDMQVDPDGVL